MFTVLTLILLAIIMDIVINKSSKTDVSAIRAEVEAKKQERLAKRIAKVKAKTEALKSKDRV